VSAKTLLPHDEHKLRSALESNRKRSRVETKKVAVACMEGKALK